jgi:hypothetical protein
MLHNRFLARQLDLEIASILSLEATLMMAK